MFLLVDCNNFYTSCEEVFNPKLKDKMVVVLSNNDGCIIARSKKAKENGIGMGEPIFNYKSLIDRKKLIIFSSNFTLYADISQRVQQVLLTFDLDMEIYSIDEAFLFADMLSQDQLIKLAFSMKEKIYKWCGIPVSIGISKTKTLAKLANKIAKKSSSGICFLFNDTEIKNALKNTKIEDVWGIGRKYQKKLKSLSIFTAKNLIDQNDEFIKKNLTVSGLRTSLELRGKSCIDLEDITTFQKSILFSRSFSNKLTSFFDLKEAISTFVSSSAKKLRKQKMMARYMSIFIATSYFDKKNTFYANSSHLNFPFPTYFTSDLIKFADMALKKIYRPNIEYKRAGILLGNFSNENIFQMDLFSSPLSFEKKKRLIKAIDKINQKQKKRSVFFAAEGLNPKWENTPINKSCKYTTSWDELPKIR